MPLTSIVRGVGAAKLIVCRAKVQVKPFLPVVCSWVFSRAKERVKVPPRAFCTWGSKLSQGAGEGFSTGGCTWVFSRAKAQLKGFLPVVCTWVCSRAKVRVKALLGLNLFHLTIFPLESRVRMLNASLIHGWEGLHLGFQFRRLFPSRLLGHGVVVIKAAIGSLVLRPSRFGLPICRRGTGSRGTLRRLAGAPRLRGNPLLRHCLNRQPLRRWPSRCGLERQPWP
jgi:hypothetical protein